MSTIKELLTPYINNLLEPLLVLSKLMSVDKSYLYAYLDEEVDINIEKEFKEIMEKIGTDYPIQYILKEKEFMSLNLYVEEGVLIPRNDTETLVEYLIDYINNKSLEILEIGYGSGAIAISLAYYCKKSKVLGVDISDQAYKVANINKERFNLENVEFIKGDLFKPLGDEKFNIIVSNPPYIKKEEISKLSSNVKDYEPSLALDGGEDGLDFYKVITEKSLTFLSNNGLLIYEIGYDQGKEVSSIMKLNGFQDIEIIKDLQGHDRVVLGFKN